VEAGSQAVQRERVINGGGVDSILQFRLERGGNKTKRKMKRRHQTHFGSIERKCDTTRWFDDVGRMRGDTMEGKKRR
jgi:hypothetical protein